MTVEGDGQPGASKTFGFTMANEGECVEVDLELPDTVYAGPVGVEVQEGYFELTNCGDEAATIMLSVEIDLGVVDTSITIGDIPVHLGAGETISREFRFVVPPIVPAGEYGICVTAVSGDAMMTTCQTVVVVNNGESGGSSPSFRLRNYPNPFNPSTNVLFELTRNAEINLSVFNLLGQKVATLADGPMTAGEHAIEWNGLDENGTPVSSGIYFYKLRVDQTVISRKMMIVK
jgi:hypothetical protein